MPRFSNIPPKRKIKIIVDYNKKYAEQRAVLVDIIEKEVTIGKSLLRIKSGYGDGTFNRRLADVLELNASIVYNRKS